MTKILLDQVIPAVVRSALAEQSLRTLIKAILKRNADIKAARDALVTSGMLGEQATLTVIRRNPDIEHMIRNEVWDLV